VRNGANLTAYARLKSTVLHNRIRADYKQNESEVRN
jgi:hypothetical protein